MHTSTAQASPDRRLHHGARLHWLLSVAYRPDVSGAASITRLGACTLTCHQRRYLKSTMGQSQIEGTMQLETLCMDGSYN